MRSSAADSALLKLAGTGPLLARTTVDGAVVVAVASGAEGSADSDPDSPPHPAMSAEVGRSASVDTVAAIRRDTINKASFGSNDLAAGRAR